ncbi:MAG TPA: MarR family winged helix-turn-helix transcriptional regulator [Actinomycetota bacterium]|jgi:DNA-binding MarR family transcriptional regulator|nr:MarR family winged helix-turn-helix transcriptional regulator [Actinomycetota bacterium]
MAPMRTLRTADYRHLLEVRTGLRRFLHWSEEQARSAGLTPAQHQLLLAVRGHPGDRPPTIGELADHLLLQHHGAVQLVDRAAAAGLVTRARDAGDHRVVRVRLTPDGDRILESLTARHLDELRRVGLAFGEISAGIEET